MRITGGKTAGNDRQPAAICRKMSAEWVGQEQGHTGLTFVYSSFSVAGKGLVWENIPQNVCSVFEGKCVPGWWLLGLRIH